MKNQELKSSLIKSGLFLAVCIFFIYAFAVSDSGGITGTIASLFSGVVFLIGLAFAVAFSIVVIIGIYFGILAMYSREVCTKSFSQFKTTLATSSGSLTRSFKCCSDTETLQQISEEDIAPLRDNQNVLNNQLTQVKNSIDSLEQKIINVSSAMTDVTAELSTLTTKAETVEEELAGKALTATVDESIKKLAGDINSIQNSITPLNTKISELETSVSSQENEEESVDVQEVVNKAISGLQKELAAVKASVEGLSTESQEDEEPKDTSHRILTYFASKEDQDQFTTLVNEAVANEMTYAEIGEHLNDNLSAENAEIIADHPSLTKDFIRICRQKD